MKHHPLANCEECPLHVENAYVPSTIAHKPQLGATNGQVDESSVPRISSPECSVGPSLAIVGESPGSAEVREGRPFAGPSGRLLGVVLDEHKIDKEAITYTSVVSCRPPENRTPSKIEIACCEPRLREELSGVSKILTVGNTASNAVLGGKHAITSLRIGPPRASEKYPGVEVIPTFSPAACLRSSDNFPSFCMDIGKINGVRIHWEPPSYSVIDNPEEVDQVVRELSSFRSDFVFDIETDYDKDRGFEHPSNARILCIGVGFAPGRVVVLTENALRNQKCIEQILSGGRLTAHNGKFDLQGTRKLAPRAKLGFDTMLASYAVDERGGAHGLKYLGTEILGMPDYSAGMKKYKTYADAPRDELYRYNAYDVGGTWGLREHYQDSMDTDAHKVNDFLTRVANALIPMEYEGIAINEEYLDQIESEFQKELLTIETELSRWVGNPRSPQQVAKAFADMGISTDTTDKEFLHLIVDTRPATKESMFAEKMLEYRGQHKLYSTYIKGARQREYQGRLYPTFLLHGTTTGRLSCRNPNLFNIPRGSSIRKLFVPSPGNLFVDVDVSQNEQRVVCALSRDRNLKELLSDKSRDLHQEIANQLGLGRQEAKVIVHAVAYEMPGKEHYLLAQHANKPLAWARNYTKKYFELFPDVAKWKRDVARSVVTDSEDLITHYGRHRRFWLITDQNRQDIIRQAIAFQPQSIGSDIVLTALTRLLEMGVKCRLSVYDNIMAECEPDQAKDLADLISKTIEEAGAEFTDFVPFHTDAKIGKNWGELG